MIFSKRIIQCRGFTLLELTLAVALASVIVLFGVNRYRDYMFQNNVTAIKGSVELLMNAMANYYYENCATNNNFINGSNLTISIGSLVGTIPNSKQISNPLNPNNGTNGINSFTMSFAPLPKTNISNKPLYGTNWLQSQDWLMKVTMSLESSYNTTNKNQREAYRAVLGAKIENTNSFTWEQSVQGYSKENLTGLSPMHANLRQYSIETYVSPMTPTLRPSETRSSQLQNPCGIFDTRSQF
jgi:prepilin-type N-terminal cleavage/methylation domain-containing protein